MALHPSMDFRIRTLAYFEATCRLETLTQAAREQSISQSAITQSLDALEEHLGVQLFEIKGRNRVLTEAGLHLEQFAKEILGRCDEFRRWLDDYGDVRELRVGMVDAGVLYLLTDTLEQFRHDATGRPNSSSANNPDSPNPDGPNHPTRHANLQMFIADSNTLLERLRNFEIDLVITVGPLPDDLAGDVIAEEKLYIYSAIRDSDIRDSDIRDSDIRDSDIRDSAIRDSAIRENATSKPATRQTKTRQTARDKPQTTAPDRQVATLENWALPPSGSRTRSLIDAGLSSLGIVPNVTMESRSPAVLRQIASLGMANVVLPVAIAEESPQLAKSKGDFVCSRNFIWASRKTTVADTRIKTFLELVHSNINKSAQ